MGHRLNNWACAQPLSNSKNLKTKCVFFVVPGNGQALLGMPDTAVLNIIKLNIDSIQKEIGECKTEGRKCMQVLMTTQTRLHLAQPNKMAMVNNTKQTK